MCVLSDFQGIFEIFCFISFLNLSNYLPTNLWSAAAMGTKMARRERLKKRWKQTKKFFWKIHGPFHEHREVPRPGTPSPTPFRQLFECVTFRVTLWSNSENLRTRAFWSVLILRTHRYEPILAGWVFRSSRKRHTRDRFGLLVRNCHSLFNKILVRSLQITICIF